MTDAEAKQKALDDLDPALAAFGTRAWIFDERTIRKPYGWIFLYQSEAYVRSGDPSDLLAGNGPVVVLERDGTVHRLGTAYPVEQEIEMFERRERLSQSDPARKT